MTLRQALWIILGLALVAGVYLTPAPHPGESNLHYILAGETGVGAFAASVVASICAVSLFFSYSAERAGCTYCGSQLHRCQRVLEPLDCPEYARAIESPRNS